MKTDTKPEHPDEVLAALKKNRNPRVCRNLDILHRVCWDIYNGKETKDFSPAHVGRLSEKNKGPTMNTLYSPGGKRFRELMAAWASYAGVASTRPIAQRKKPNDEDTLLRGIDDLVIREEVALIIGERNRLRSEIKVHKAQGNAVVDLRAKLSPESAVRDGNQIVQILQPLALLLSHERESLEDTLNQNWLAQHKMQAGGAGEIVYLPTGKLLFKPGFTKAIAKLLGNSGRHADLSFGPKDRQPSPPP
jgi:hypothetical protein